MHATSRMHKYLWPFLMHFSVGVSLPVARCLIVFTVPARRQFLIAPAGCLACITHVDDDDASTIFEYMFACFYFR